MTTEQALIVLKELREDVIAGWADSYAVAYRESDILPALNTAIDILEEYDMKKFMKIKKKYIAVAAGSFAAFLVWILFKPKTNYTPLERRPWDEF